MKKSEEISLFNKEMFSSLFLCNGREQWFWKTKMYFYS